MLRYILKRILIAIPVLLGITLLDYLLMSIAGSPLEMLIGPRVTEAAIEQKAIQLGLDQPFIVQYFTWLGQIIQGNLGFSFKQNLPVASIILQYLKPSLKLSSLAFLLSVAISIPAGIYSAVNQYSKADYALVTTSFISSSIPSFFLALILIYIFNLKLGILPSSGMQTLGSAGGFLDSLKHLILPLTVLVSSLVGVNIRYIRASMLEILNQDYLRTARAKGIGKKKVISKHALRNALLPIVTLFGMQVPMLFSGSVVVEQVFSWPGLGLQTMNAILNRDYPLIMGISLLTAIVVLVSNLITDIVYALVDPTISYN